MTVVRSNASSQAFSESSRVRNYALIAKVRDVIIMVNRIRILKMFPQNYSHHTPDIIPRVRYSQKKRRGLNAAYHGNGFNISLS